MFCALRAQHGAANRAGRGGASCTRVAGEVGLAALQRLQLRDGLVGRQLVRQHYRHLPRDSCLPPPAHTVRLGIPTHTQFHGIVECISHSH